MLYFPLIVCACLGTCLTQPETDIEIEIIKSPDECDRTTEENDLLYIHYKSFFSNGTQFDSR